MAHTTARIPTSSLDPEMLGEMLEVMKRLALDGMTMVIVTHKMGFARDVADRIVFMEEGALVLEEQPDKFFDSKPLPRGLSLTDEGLSYLPVVQGSIS